MGLAFTGSVPLAAPAAAVFPVVADLTTYPSWLGIVQRVVVDDGSGEGGRRHEPGWLVDIGARLGFLSRSKRVRMVRTVFDAPTHVRWERSETDGRPHPQWVLEGRLVDDVLTMHLAYDGGMPLPGIDLLLREEVRRAGPRLEAMVRQ